MRGRMQAAFPEAGSLWLAAAVALRAFQGATSCAGSRACSEVKSGHKPKPRRSPLTWRTARRLPRLVDAPSAGGGAPTAGVGPSSAAAAAAIVALRATKGKGQSRPLSEKRPGSCTSVTRLSEWAADMIHLSSCAGTAGHTLKCSVGGPEPKLELVAPEHGGACVKRAMKTHFDHP